jgi:flagellar basal-body rod modification protein FlgD
MTQIPSALQSLTSAKPSSSTTTLRGLETDDFLKLMIAELQNQDPLNPLENSEMLQQITQIREIGATQTLTETLESVLLGQNISSATNLIGTQIRALTDSGATATGIVRRVTILDGQPQLHIDSGSTAEPVSGGGDLDAGFYSYRVVMTDADGFEQSVAYDVGSAAVLADDGGDAAIQLLNLPETAGLKKIYRTDSSGQEPYYLVNTIAGHLTSYVDGVADGGLAPEVLAKPSNGRLDLRTFTVKLSNVAEIHAAAN